MGWSYCLVDLWSGLVEGTVVGKNIGCADGWIDG
jgi:hypothetical protein